MNQTHGGSVAMGARGEASGLSLGLRKGAVGTAEAQPGSRKTRRGSNKPKNFWPSSAKTERDCGGSASAGEGDGNRDETTKVKLMGEDGCCHGEGTGEKERGRCGREGSGNARGWSVTGKREAGDASVPGMTRERRCARETSRVTREFPGSLSGQNSEHTGKPRAHLGVPGDLGSFLGNPGSPRENPGSSWGNLGKPQEFRGKISESPLETPGKFQGNSRLRKTFTQNSVTRTKKSQNAY